MNLRTKPEAPRNDQYVGLRMPTALRDKVRDFARRTNAVSEAEAVRFIIAHFFSEECQLEVDKMTTEDKSA